MFLNSSISSGVKNSNHSTGFTFGTDLPSCISHFRQSSAPRSQSARHSPPSGQIKAAALWATLRRSY
jgi:hypothetical protein